MNPLFDHPTYRLLRGIEREQAEIIAWGEAARAALTAEPGDAARAGAFAGHLERYLAAAGGIAGGDTVDDAELPPARWDGTDYAMDAEPRRDARFVDRFNCSARIDDIYAPTRSCTSGCARWTYPSGWLRSSSRPAAGHGTTTASSGGNCGTRRATR
jgi:hypothetical protein